MAVLPALSASSDSSRKRRTHRKSRNGCGNCKVRRVKCDETQPRCKKCISAALVCNYDPKASDLELAFAGSFTLDLSQHSPSPQDTVLSKINAHGNKQAASGSRQCQSYEWTKGDLERLARFRNRTAITFESDHGSGVYRRHIEPLSLQHPYLLHIAMAMTMAHDRYSLPGYYSKQADAIAFHYCRAASLLGSKLSEPLTATEKDAVWATSAFLGIMSTSFFRAETPEQAWPLKPDAPDDLSWMRLSGGKHAVWDITNPSRPDSIFREMAENWLMKSLEKPDNPGREGLPSNFDATYGLDKVSSTVETNAYHGLASLIGDLMGVPCNRSTVVYFMAFTGMVKPPFKRLLEMKEPRALLLMALWYSKLCEFPVWWFFPRAFLESQAILIYLGRHHGHEAWLQEFLPYIKLPGVRGEPVSGDVAAIIVSETETQYRRALDT